MLSLLPHKGLACIHQPAQVHPLCAIIGHKILFTTQLSGLACLHPRCLLHCTYLWSLPYCTFIIQYSILVPSRPMYWSVGCIVV